MKILVTRRGQPVHREALLDLLWPDEDPSQSSSRLSVVLSTARAVLDPDKRFDPHHFVAGDRSTIRLCVEHVRIDVEEFLESAEAGRLAEAEARYGGEFLAEDPYEDWAVALREEARSAYLAVARRLAHEAASDDPDRAIRHLLRILGQDPYDEHAHLFLVAVLAGNRRHGEARRAYRAYSQRMEEIDVEPAPFPHP